MWVAVITTSAVFVRNSPDPPMKSIRKYRMSRQALKKARVDRAAALSPEEVQFPLGPRSFRKSQALPHHEASLEIVESSPTTDAPEAPGLRIIPHDEVEKEQAGKQSTRRKRGWNGSKASAEEPAAQEQTRPAEAEETLFPPAQEEPPAEETEFPFDPQPIVVAAADPIEESPPVAAAARMQTEIDLTPPEGEAGMESNSEPKAAPPRKTRPKEGKPVEKLSPYALNDGTHSYVLVDDEGHWVKTGSRRNQKR